MRRCLGNVVPGDDEVQEAVRERTYQKYPNPIYEMGWVLINILDRNRLRGGSLVERYVDLSARSCTVAPGQSRRLPGRPKMAANIRDMIWRNAPNLRLTQA
jgi:hypothetical protein